MHRVSVFNPYSRRWFPPSMLLSIKHGNSIPFLDEMLRAIGMIWICNSVAWAEGHHYLYHGRRQVVEVEVYASGGAFPVPHVKAETTYSRYTFDFTKEAPMANWGRPQVVRRRKFVFMWT